MSLIPKVMTGDLDTPGRGGSGAGGPGGQAGGSGSPAENLGQRATTCDCHSLSGQAPRTDCPALPPNQKNAPKKSMPAPAIERPVGMAAMFRRLRVKPWAYPEDVDAIEKYVLDLEKKELPLQTIIEEGPR